MKFDIRLPIALAGVAMIIVSTQMLGGCKPNRNADQSVRDSLIRSAEASRIDADSTRSKARQQIASDSIRWRSFALESISKARAQIRDSSQRAMNLAVARAREDVRLAFGDSTNSFSAAPEDTNCLVWATCADDAVRSAADSLLRSRLDSSRFADEVARKSCSAAVSEERSKRFSESQPKEKSNVIGILMSIFTGLLGFFGGIAF